MVVRPAVPTLAGSVQSDVEGNIRGALWVRDVLLAGGCEASSPNIRWQCTE